MRKHLAQGFSTIYLVDLGGNVRHNPKLSGTTHNVFGIQVGVAITILVKHAQDEERERKILYARMPENWRRGQKTAQLDEWKSVGGATCRRIKPDKRQTWLNEDQEIDFESLMPLSSKGLAGPDRSNRVFNIFSLGVTTNRDLYAYNFCADDLKVNIKRSIAAYQAELVRFKHTEPPRPNPDDFVDADRVDLKWTRQTKASLRKLEAAHFDVTAIRPSLYRPFTVESIYLQDFWNEEQYQTHLMFPSLSSSNKVICVPPQGARAELWTFSSKYIPNLNLMSIDAAQCFPFYTYNEDGTNRQENITDCALTQYQTHYADPSITKWDIFHSTYALLHHPEYRTRYAANLKRELPRIPFPPDLHAFAQAGKRLMELHIDYEQQPEYKLEEIDNREIPFTLRVERMRLSKDKTELRYNEALTLRGIPPEVYTYRLGNRSALEWVIDQYRVSTDPRSGITNDPNRAGDEGYILRLIKQVITVSLETQQIIAGLPSLNFASSVTSSEDTASPSATLE